MEGNAYINFEDYTNVSEAWYLLDANFKLQGFRFLNGAKEKILFLTLNKCKNAANYITRFCSIVIKLKNFFTKF